MSLVHHIIVWFVALQVGRSCMLRPEINDFNWYSRYQGEMKWSLAIDSSCSTASVARYEIQQLCSDSCDLQSLSTWYTPSNDTSVCVNLNLTSARECFLRVRPELNDSLYSECVQIDAQFFLGSNTWYVDQRTDLCVPIIASCNNLRRRTFFYLNNEPTDWPSTPTPAYNISLINGTQHFCFNNVSEKTELLEFCYMSPSSACSWCTENFGYRVSLLSKAIILIRQDINECEGNHSCTGYCVNTDGSFVCACESGFWLNIDQQTCININECENGYDECHQNATCIDTHGSYQCTCNDGFYGDGWTTCNLIGAVCDQITITVNESDAFQGTQQTLCACNFGYRLDSDKTSCIDINECQIGLFNACNKNATCMNTNGSFTCICNDGFYGNGSICLDEDECSSGLASCPKNSTCNNIVGGFYCECDDDFFDDGNGNCRAVGQPEIATDPTVKPNHLLEYRIGNDFCLEDINAIINFSINCLPRNTPVPEPTVQWLYYTGEALNESDTNLSNVLDIRNNRSTLSFEPTSFLNLSRLFMHPQSERETLQIEFTCVLMNSIGNDTQRSEITECSLHQCQDGITNNCNQVCNRNVTGDGDHVCRCFNDRYTLDSDNSTCIDIDECSNPEACNDTTQDCINSIGGYECVCKEGFEEDPANSSACVDIDECSRSFNTCPRNATCNNTFGGFVCECDEGFKEVPTGKNKIDCINIDECNEEDGYSPCSEHANCTDTIGSFVCGPCAFGYTGNGTVCEDIDECHEKNCSYSCENHIGFAECTCGFGYRVDEENCTVDPRLLGPLVSVGVVILIIAIILCVVGLRRCYKRMRETYTVQRKEILSPIGKDETKMEGMFGGSDNLRQFRVQSSLTINIPQELVIHSSNIEMLKTVGQGEFGVVYKARLLHGIDRRVKDLIAVKTLKGFLNKALVKALLKECMKMQQFDHPNVLKLTGVCMDGGPSPYLVMPFMMNGSLLAYLKKERDSLVISQDSDSDDNRSIALKRLLDMCIQVAKGMEYLASKKFVHRDLAARNCMIDFNYIIKVADFGLAEQLEAKDYFRQDQGVALKLPVKWLAPESLMDCVFSEKTDVWAYGVTCWEIFSGGKTPYAGDNPSQLPSLLESGHRMEKPMNEACNDEIYSFILNCWESDPKNRPNFSAIVESLSLRLESMADYLDIGAFGHKLTCPASQTGGGGDVVNEEDGGHTNSMTEEATV